MNAEPKRALPGPGKPRGPKRAPMGRVEDVAGRVVAVRIRYEHPVTLAWVPWTRGMKEPSHQTSARVETGSGETLFEGTFGLCVDYVDRSEWDGDHEGA